MSLVTEVDKLRKRIEEMATLTDDTRSGINKHEEQINGRRGLSAAIDGLSREVHEDMSTLREDVKSMKRLLWGVGATVATSSIGFAITVLLVFGN